MALISGLTIPAPFFRRYWRGITPDDQASIALLHMTGKGEKPWQNQAINFTSRRKR
jgi:hypothetical protein